jgi:hypothetical protein
MRQKLPLPGAAIAIPDPTDPSQTLHPVSARFFHGDEPKLSETGPYAPHFAHWLTARENEYFAAAAVNRLWAHFFARGLVNPIDAMQVGNEPSHPEVLAALEQEFKTSGFDQKHLIRAICNSQAYQRTSRPLAENASDEQWFSHMAVKVLGPEAMCDSLAIAMGQKPPQGQSRTRFVDLFTTKEVGDDPTEFTHGVPQFLSLMNSRQYNAGSPVLNTLAGSSPEQAIERLYLTVLSRRPSAPEVERMTAFVAGSSEPRTAYADLLWVFLNSAEFVVNR